jgi:NADH-quinone oxidoreductase subunit L
MATDPRLLTFLKYLSGFTAAMLVLVTANNYVLMFMGWEGVGIFSYLLIGFWYTRTLALKASLKAVIVNKIGDVALLIAIGLMLHYFGTTNFLHLKILITYLVEYKINAFDLIFFPEFKVNLISLISFFLLIAAVGKSAQFGLHTWLPDAMEGPTPVSALIHAATMVTAGVYLIVRSSFLFELSETIQDCVLVIGAFTALFGSAVACFQYDIKKIIAFSTCSQIGYMFLACGLSAYNVAMFHLFTHAFFKALLFLCAGSIIHAISDEQDI